MTMALLVITIGLGVSAILTPVVVRQFSPTRSLVDRTTQLDAAQTGMDVMMARVRAASATNSSDGVVGLLEDLPPCSMSGNAGAGGTGESLPWSVKLTYYDADGNVLAAWNDPSKTCPPNDVPTTATVVSTGTGANGKARTLTATYVFTTSNSAIPGGAVRIDTSSAGKLCFDAGSTHPAVGYAVLLKTCTGSSQQQFGYTSDLFLKLINSESGTAPDGLCLFPGTKLTATSHAKNDVINFQKCPFGRASTAVSGVTVNAAQWQWALDGASQFKSTSGTNPGQATEGLCISVVTAGSVGSQLALNSCTSSTTATIFRSDAGVGAGMAGDATNQIVNYAQFSRCLDVTGKDPNAAYMIAWFCKQSPNGGVDTNQQWAHPVPIAPDVFAKGNIIVTLSSKTYCLKSPLNTAATAYVTVTACAGSTDEAKAVTTAGTLWTVYHDTGDYGTSYRIVDPSGFCLTPTDLTVTNPDTISDGTSKVKVAVCSSNELQKWNAPPNIDKPTPLTDMTEN